MAGLTDGASIARLDWSPDLPASRVELHEPTAAPPVTRVQPPTEAGMPLVAVWRTPDRRAFAAAAFVDHAVGTCGRWPSHEVRTTLAFTRAMAGGGVFDLDGRLLGVILPCGDRYAAITHADVDAVLPAVESFESRLLARYGLVVERLTDGEAAFFKAASGVIVRELRAGQPAAAAGLRPGDLVVGVNGAPISRLEELRGLAEASPLSNAVLSIQRGSATLDVAMPIATTATMAASASAAGVVVEAPRTGVRVATVQPGSRVAAAGIRSDDRIIRVGAREMQSSEQLLRALEVPIGGGVFVEFERDDRRRGVLLAGKPR